MINKEVECCIIGAGPAGLGTAVELLKNGISDILIIDKNKIVGGLSRTENFNGYRFDVGPHRFYTKNSMINDLWHEMLGNDFKPVNRLTRIYYKEKFFNYPIKAFDALNKLGIFESSQALLSYLWASLGKKDEPQTFEDWISQKFGTKLYETFFKTYTEKVWGIPCTEIGAEWAAQRIKGLDISEIIKSFLRRNKNGKIKTLVEQFDYPVKGAGQMYEAMADYVSSKGGKIQLETKVERLNRNDHSINSIDVLDENHQKIRISAKHYFNSAPLTHFFKMLMPSVNTNILQAAETLYYRDHITVNMLVDKKQLFPDQWIYVHSQEVKMARLANYNNFSEAMVNYKNKTAISAEYFVFQHEDLWNMQDDEIKQLAINELEGIGLIPKNSVENTWVVRETESYPTYYLGFQKLYDILKLEVDKFLNLTPIGRGGLYKYNNQDHSIMSGILAAKNYLKLEGHPYNIWNINIDSEYLESGERKTE